MHAKAILVALALAAAPTHAGDLLAIRVGRAETASQGAIEHAVILVDDGSIVAVGQDLAVERGIPVLDRPDWWVMPGLVNCYTRVGMDSQSGDGFEPQQLASGELYPRDEVYAELLEVGVTTLGLYPPGGGIPGQAVAVRTRGETAEEMILRDGAYLKVLLYSNPGSKKMLRDGFEEVDEYEEDEAKRREKWEKDQEKKKKRKKKDDDEDDDESDEPTVYVPEEPDPKVVPFMQLREGTLSALISIRKAGDYLHLLDAIGEEEFDWGLRVPLRSGNDLYEVADRIGERGCRVVLDPLLTNHPATRRLRNIPAELAEHGAKVVLVPDGTTSVSAHEEWLADVGRLVAAGLDRDAAVRAVTLEAAAVLGLDERLGSIDPDKDANLIFFDGDPFEPASRLVAVMLEGEFVSGEVKQ